MSLHCNHANGGCGLPGVKKSPGRRAVKPREESPEIVLSRRGCLQARAKWSFPVCQTIVKMKPAEQARRNEDVGFGFTSNGVASKKL